MCTHAAAYFLLCWLVLTKDENEFKISWKWIWKALENSVSEKGKLLPLSCFSACWPLSLLGWRQPEPLRWPIISACPLSRWLTSWSRAIYRWRGGPTRRRRLPHPAEAERDLFWVHSHARIFRGLWRACHTLAPIKAAHRPCPRSLVRCHLCPSFAPLRAVWISLTSRREVAAAVDDLCCPAVLPRPLTYSASRWRSFRRGSSSLSCSAFITLRRRIRR